MNAVERLTAARVAARDMARQIDAAVAARRAALISDDDAGAERIDRKLAELRAAGARAADKVCLLGQLVDNELFESNWPNDLTALRSLLGRTESELATLRMKHPRDRSAADQARLDALTGHVPALQSRVVLLERMGT